MRVVVWPWFFTLPWFDRFDGHAAWNVIVLREPISSGLGDESRDGLGDGTHPVPETASETASDDDLITHELCHVWQMQHRPFAMPLSYLRGYSRNPHELEARQAVEVTRS